MEILWLLFFVFLPLAVSAMIWWFRAAKGIVRAANALERIAFHIEHPPVIQYFGGGSIDGPEPPPIQPRNEYVPPGASDFVNSLR